MNIMSFVLLPYYAKLIIKGITTNEDIKGSNFNRWNKGVLQNIHTIAC